MGISLLRHDHRTSNEAKFHRVNDESRLKPGNILGVDVERHHAVPIALEQRRGIGVLPSKAFSHQLPLRSTTP